MKINKTKYGIMCLRYRELVVTSGERERGGSTIGVSEWVSELSRVRLFATPWTIA